LTANRVLLSDGSGFVSASSITNTTLGYLDATSSIQTQINSKQATLTTGNLTETTSSVLTITGGTGAVIGTGTTIQVKQASGTVSGFLSSTDWTTFNGKQAALSGLTTNGVIYATSATAEASTAAGTTGQFLQANTGAAPTWGTPSGSGTVNSGTQYQLGYYATTTNAISGLTLITANRALISDANGLPVASAVTNTTLAFLDATSSVQTQLNAKAATTSVFLMQSPVQGTYATQADSTSGSYADTGISITI